MQYISSKSFKVEALNGGEKPRRRSTVSRPNPGAANIPETILDGQSSPPLHKEALMGFLARVRKNVSSPSLPQSYPTFSDVSQRARQFSIRNLMRRRVRLKTISVPLLVVILFPLAVVILALVLFLRHPDSPGRVLMPAGSPPSIRYVLQLSLGDANKQLIRPQADK